MPHDNVYLCMNNSGAVSQMSRKCMNVKIRDEEEVEINLPAFFGKHVVRSQQLPVAHVAFEYNLHV